MKGYKGTTVGKWVSGIAGVLASIIFCATNASALAPKPSVPIKFAWDSSGDATVTGYAVYYGVVGGSTTNRTDVGALLEVSLKTLAPGANYFFYVKAYNSTGLESAPSSVISYAPPAITDITLVAQEDGTMRVSFMGPASTSCRVEYTSSYPPQWQTLATVTSTTDGLVVVNDPPAGRPEVRFYRAVVP